MHTGRPDGSTQTRSALPSGAAARRPLVLVVEDDADSRDIYRTILRASGFAVVETANGTDGLRLADECAPDVILMDLGMPGTDGWAAIRSLRERAETATIPVVVVSGHVLPEHEARAREAGCVAFLAKPIEPRTIVAEIRRILAPARAHAITPASRPIAP